MQLLIKNNLWKLVFCWTKVDFGPLLVVVLRHRDKPTYTWKFAYIHIYSITYDDFQLQSHVDFSNESPFLLNVTLQLISHHNLKQINDTQVHLVYFKRKNVSWCGSFIHLPIIE